MNNMYYVMLEVVPTESNDENSNYSGAFLNCLVNCNSEKLALRNAKKYAFEQGWNYVGTEEISIVQREIYLEEEDVLEAYDDALEEGISGIFYCW